MAKGLRQLLENLSKTIARTAGAAIPPVAAVQKLQAPQVKQVAYRVKPTVRQLAQRVIEYRRARPTNVLGGQIVRRLGPLGQALPGFVEGTMAYARPSALYENIPQPKTTAEKAVRTAAGLTGFALGPGKIFYAPIESKVISKVIPKVSALPRIAQRVLPAVAAEAISSGAFTPLRAAIERKPVKEVYGEELSAGLGGRALFGGLGMALPLVASQFKVGLPEAKIPKELESLGGYNLFVKEARKSKSVEEFKGGILQKLDNLWKKWNEIGVEGQTEYQNIISMIEKGRENYLTTPELKKAATKKRKTVIEDWAMRDAENKFFQDFYDLATKGVKEVARKVPKEIGRVFAEKFRADNFAVQDTVYGLRVMPTTELGEQYAKKFGREVTPENLTNFYKSIKEVGEVVSEGIPAKVPNLADEVSAPEVAAKKFFGWFDDIRRRLENEYHPVEKVARIVKKKGMALPSLEDPEILVKRNLGSTGIAEAELYGLGDIIRPHAGEIDNLKTYLKSKRAIDLEERGIKTGIKLEDAQAAVKQFANQFEDTAQRLYMYQRSILHNYLVQTGMLSEETFQKIIAANPNYVPFKRLFEEAGITEFVPKKKAGVPIKRIKGSEREILDPLESIIENTYKAVTAGEQNRLWRSVAQIGEQFPELGIKKIKPKIFPVGTIEHRAAIDKQYIDEVSKFAKNLGAKIKTGGQVGRALGYFHHAGDVVERKFATPEEVISHEVGHFLDKKYSLKQRFYQRGKTKTVGQEITQFMRDQGQSSNRVKKVSERFATAFEWWLSNRNLAEKDIPLFSKEIEKIIGEIPELKPLINIRPRPGLSVETMSQKIFAKSTFKPTPNSISFFDNGEQVFYEVPEEIAKVANSLGNVQNIVFKLLSYPTKLVRTGATGISPEFGLIRNPLRDQFTALWNSESGYKPFLDLLRGISHYSGNDDLYRMYLGSGAGQSYFVSLDREFKAKTLDELLKGTTFIRKGTGLLGILQDISQVTEAGTRLGEYQKALQKTGDPWQAAKAAREVTVDFSRIGKDFRVANQLIAFINARVQGTIQAVKSAIKHPARAGILGVSLGVVPATLLYLHNRQYKEWYDIEDWEKRNNWIVLYGKPGEAKMFEIPKDFIIGKLFGSTTENFLSFIDKTDPKALENLAGNILDFFSPVTNLGEALPAAIKPIVEHVANYNFFLGRELVPEYMKARPTAGQYFKGTREIAKVIGSRIGVAPTVVDNYLYSYLPGVFTGVINLVDYALGGKIFEDVAKLPFIRVFSVSGTGKISREIKSAFYNLRDKRTAISSIAKSEIYSKEEKVRLIGAVIKSMANDIKIMNGYLQAAAGKKPVFEITPEPKVPYEAPGIARKAGAAIAAAPPQQGLLAPAAQPLYRVSGKKVKVPALKTTRLKIKKIIKPTKKKVVYRIKAMEKMPTIPRTTLPKL